MSNKTPEIETEIKWASVIPQERWRGFRRTCPGVDAFQSVDSFESAQQSELENGLEDHEKQTLGRLLKRGNKLEIEVFIRTHGPNPIIDPQATINIPVGVAKADTVDLTQKATSKANQAILNGDLVHVLFQAGEASRFNAGPFLKLNPTDVARQVAGEFGFEGLLSEIDATKKNLPPEIAAALVDGPLGSKQPLMIHAALRRIISDEIANGSLTEKEAEDAYKQALKNQKVLFFVSHRGGVSEAHDVSLRETFKFYGFDPKNIITIEQQLVRGLTVNESGVVSLLEDEEASDAAGHLYALLQAARPEDFTSYTESGRPFKTMEMDGLAYLASRGGKILNIVRINDMDRHTTEIINPKAVAYALTMFEKGYSNVIEGVSNPKGQKGGTGTWFVDEENHSLTETHENSFPSLSRIFEEAMKTYLKKNEGRHPAYNAMRQLADLASTRRVLREFGARIVFVPRQKLLKGQTQTYLGVDMPMGDLSLISSHYKSRMFQFVDGNKKELLIHDMKKKENLDVALRTILHQLKDPHIISAARELYLKKGDPFSASPASSPVYGAPTPEFD